MSNHTDCHTNDLNILQDTGQISKKYDMKDINMETKPAVKLVRENHIQHFKADRNASF